MLKAIEDEHFDLLPGGVFNKGFVRAYAKHLGLNDEEAISEYLVCLRQAQVDAQSAAWEQADPHQVSSRVPRQIPGQLLRDVPRDTRVDQKSAMPATNVTPPQQRTELSPEPKMLERKMDQGADSRTERKESATGNASPPQKIPAPAPPTAPVELSRRPAPQQPPVPGEDSGDRALASGGIAWRIPAIVLALIILAAVLWNRHSRSANAQGSDSAHVTSQNPIAPSARENDGAHGTLTGTANSSAPAAAPDATPSADRAAIISPKSGPTGSSQSPSLSSSVAGSPSAVTAKQSIPAVKNAENRENVPSARPIAPRSIPLPSRDPAVKPAPTFTLVIRATETSWISVIADGQTVNQETLIAPAHTSIRASRQIVVRAGNAAGVSFLLNGKEIPVRGAEAEVKTYVFDSTGLASVLSPDSAR
jgi:cytoskeletal protein RodZ